MINICKRKEEFANCQDREKISSKHYIQLIKDISNILRSEPDISFISSYYNESDEKIEEALEFIERYLSLNLDDFNASSLLRKLREILRGDDYPKEE